MREDNRYTRQVDGKVTILAPQKAGMVSYHQGLSCREAYLAARSAFSKAGGRRKCRRVTLSS